MSGMLEPGARIPDVTVHGGRRALELRGLAAEGPVLLAFYLFDWTGT